MRNRLVDLEHRVVATGHIASQKDARSSHRGSEHRRSRDNATDVAARVAGQDCSWIGDKWSHGHRQCRIGSRYPDAPGRLGLLVKDHRCSRAVTKRSWGWRALRSPVLPRGSWPSNWPTNRACAHSYASPGFRVPAVGVRGQVFCFCRVTQSGLFA